MTICTKQKVDKNFSHTSESVDSSAECSNRPLVCWKNTPTAMYWYTNTMTNIMNGIHHSPYNDNNTNACRVTCSTASQSKHTKQLTYHKGQRAMEIIGPLEKTIDKLYCTVCCLDLWWNPPDVLHQSFTAQLGFFIQNLCLTWRNWSNSGSNLT